MHIRWQYALTAAVFGIACMVMSRIQYSGSVWGTTEENCLLPWKWSVAWIFFAAAVIGYGILIFLDFLFKKAICEEKTDSWSRKKFALICGIVIFIVWLPYYLSYYPGGIYSDTFASVKMALGKEKLSNMHPVIYTLALKAVMKFSWSIGKNMTWALGLFFTIQMLAVETSVVGLGCWLIKRKIPKKIIIVSMLYLIFFPLVPLNAVSVWKDTPFSLAVLWYVVNLIDLYLDRKNQREHYALPIKCLILGALVILTRNNGVYVVVGTVIIYIAATLKQYRNRKYQWLVYSFAVLSILSAMVIEGPVYRKIGVQNRNFTAFLGIPLQQVGRAVAYDGNVTEEQKAELDLFLPYENIKEKYVPCLTDSLKWYADVDQKYFNAHQKEFFRLWAELLVQNPEEYIKAYIMNTAGFWCLNVAGFDAYIQNYVWPNGYHVEQTDYFEKWFGFSFQQLVNPKKAISSAWYFWLLLFSMVVCIKNFGLRTGCVYMPLFLVWATLMIATPIAVSMRYVQPLVFAAPLYAAIPVIMGRERK